ncbi:hypothetical protein NEOKW01_0686 [Nematocida sp. AWRm80]|nr:hypothetical protein NEOKW01_0686 [Nematocida sp. AWRm80]
MTMKRSLRKVLLAAAQVVLAQSVQGYTCGMNNGGCGEGGIGSVDDRFFYGDFTDSDVWCGGLPTSGYCGQGGDQCGSGSCGIGGGSAIGGGFDQSFGGSSIGSMGGFGGNSMSSMGGNSMGGGFDQSFGGSSIGSMGGFGGNSMSTMGGNFSQSCGSNSMGGGASFGQFPASEYPSVTSFDNSTAYYTPSGSYSAQTQQAAAQQAMPQQIMAQQAGVSVQPLNQASGEPITLLLNGNLPVDVVPSQLTVGDVTYPLPTGVPAISSVPVAAPAVAVTDLVVVDLPLAEHPRPCDEEPLAGTSAEQLKKEQCKKDKKKKCPPKAAAKKCPPKKKSGVAGLSTLAAIAILPLVAVLL